MPQDLSTRTPHKLVLSELRERRCPTWDSTHTCAGFPAKGSSENGPQNPVKSLPGREIPQEENPSSRQRIHPRAEIPPTRRSPHTRPPGPGPAPCSRPPKRPNVLQKHRTPPGRFAATTSPIAILKMRSGGRHLVGHVSWPDCTNAKSRGKVSSKAPRQEEAQERE